jgi:hypothetical protein
MEHLTYHQVLADMYEENSKNVLVEQTEYEEEVPPEDKHPDELENQEEFQQQHGSRQAVEVPTNKPVYKDLTTNSVRYNKDIKTRILSIDSRFRQSYFVANKPTLALPGLINQRLEESSQFNYTLVNPIKNVVSIRLSSVEIPNTFYTFSVAKGNTTFTIIHPSGSGNRYIATIPDGNYTAVATTGPDDFALAIRTAMENATTVNGTLINPGLLYQFTVSISLIKSTIEIRMFQGSIPENFDLDFTQNQFSDRAADWGLGYNMGFRQQLLTNQPVFIGSAVVDTVGFNYIYVGLHPDWRVIQHNSPLSSGAAVFGKIIVNVPKFDVIYDDGSNTLTKEYWLQQPTDIKSFQISLYDPYEELIDLAGMDWSLTVELKEILNTALYDHIREL